MSTWDFEFQTLTFCAQTFKSLKPSSAHSKVAARARASAPVRAPRAGATAASRRAPGARRRLVLSAALFHGNGVTLNQSTFYCSYRNKI
jgi:hypothetical protein